MLHNSQNIAKNLIILFLMLANMCFLFKSHVIAQDENLRVFDRWLKYTDAPNALYHHCCDQAFQYLDKRASEVTKLKTKSQWLERQETTRKTLLDMVGPFPEKTPLDAKVVDTVRKNGYHVEKIIYESRPKFYVTACLFVPEGLKGKTPAIIYCSGHSSEAFRSLTYQRIIVNLVKKGFIVFAFDPVSQGERLQYFAPELGESRVGGPTLEHSYPGAQCLISGSSQARHMIWDGIRAIDYLLTRKEVDPQRIGITGRSGGGTQSSYIAAFDDRIHAVAPECYITSLRRLLESIGPQDAEQNFYHGIASGYDHADLLEVRAPKPALMITTTCDFFSIQGARETAEEVKKAYRAFGKEENFAMVEDDAPHASTRKNREAMYAFFQKHLNLAGSSTDEDVEFLSPEELRVTKTGQLLNSLGGETIFSLNKSETQKLLDNLEKSHQDLRQHLESVIPSARELSGYVRPDSPSDVVFTGRYQREGYSIEKYFIQGEGDYEIPFIMMIPNEGKKHPVVIYLHPISKSSEASPDGEMEWFVKKGYAVIAPDLIGTGEMGPGVFKGDAFNFKLGSISYNIWFAPILIGRSIVGIRAGDMMRIVNYLNSREDIETEGIVTVARGEMCPVLLHAAAFEDDITKIALIEPLVSYRAIVMNQYYKPHFIPVTVAGSLTAYDLPDLAASLAPRDLLMVNVTDQNGKRAEPELLERDLRVVRKAYSAMGSKENITIRNWEAYQSIDDIFSEWLQ